MKNAIRHVMAAAVLLAPLGAMAGGSYVKLGIGHSTFDYPGGIPDDHPSGYLLAYGMSLDPTWGVEGGLVSFGRVEVFDSNNNLAKLSVHALYAAGTASYPINPQAAIYGKLGLGLKYFSGGGDSETRVDPVLGVGGRWMFSPQWGASVEYTHYGKDGGVALTQTTLAAIYNF